MKFKSIASLKYVPRRIPGKQLIVFNQKFFILLTWSPFLTNFLTQFQLQFQA